MNFYRHSKVLIDIAVITTNILTNEGRIKIAWSVRENGKSTGWIGSCPVGSGLACLSWLGKYKQVNDPEFILSTKLKLNEDKRKRERRWMLVGIISTVQILGGEFTSVLIHLAGRIKKKGCQCSESFTGKGKYSRPEALLGQTLKRRRG